MNATGSESIAGRAGAAIGADDARTSPLLVARDLKRHYDVSRGWMKPKATVRALGLGAADFIPKPVDRARLLATVRDQLSLHRRLSKLSAVENGLGDNA